MSLETAERIEALLARPYPTTKDVETFCSQARLANYHSVVVPSALVELAYDLVADNGLKICSLIGYPFGNSAPDAKRYETELAVDAGAHEIELVPSISKLLEGKYDAILREIRDVVEAADERSVRVSVELSLWTEEQLREIVRMILDSGTQFISTSVAPPVQRAVDKDDLTKLRTLVGASFGIKLGGLRSVPADLEELLQAGADRIGLLI